MSDQTQALPQKAPQSGSLRQKIFNIVGWSAFLLLAPPALQMLGLPALQDFLSAKIAAWGSPVALVIYFYAVLFLRVFFGSDQRYTPVLMGYAISFLYFSNSLAIGFMQWLRELSAQVGFLNYPYMSFITGIVVIFLSNALSGAKKARWPVDLIVLGLLPAAGLVCAGIFLPGLLGF
jgi:hypothetical protein